MCWKMFGPQARAAELQAMRSAAMRQRTHDVQERIPTPAAVSLTDFARGHPVSRNKGNKQYKPLSLEDIDSPRSEMSISSPEPEQLPMDNIPSVQVQRRSISEAAADTPSATSSTKRVIHTPQIQLLEARQRLGPADWMPTPQSRALPIGASALLSKPLEYVDFVFGSNGYSPVKPELQLEHLKTCHPEMNTMNSAFDAHHIDGYKQFTQSHYSHSQYLKRLTQTAPPHLGLDMFHFHQEPFSLDLPYLKPHFERSSSFANDILNHENQLQEVRRERSQIGEEFYDRNSKMQSFVAAQQAMAKIGRTVLYNPQPLTRSRPNEAKVTAVLDSSVSPSQRTNEFVPLHRTLACLPLSPHRDPFSSGYTPSPGSIDPIVHEKPKQDDASVKIASLMIRRKPDDCPAIERAIKRRENRVQADIPAGGSEEGRTPDADEHDEYIPPQRSRISFPIDDETGSEAWCQLKQLNAGDRQKVKSILTVLVEDFELRAFNRFYKGNPTLASSKPRVRTLEPTLTQIPNKHDSPVAQRIDSKVSCISRADQTDAMTAVEDGVAFAGSRHDKTGRDRCCNASKYVPTTYVSRSTDLLMRDSPLRASPPARLARDPRYRPLSAQTIALHESLQLW